MMTVAYAWTIAFLLRGAGVAAESQGNLIALPTDPVTVLAIEHPCLALRSAGLIVLFAVLIASIVRRPIIAMASPLIAVAVSFARCCVLVVCAGLMPGLFKMLHGQCGGATYGVGLVVLLIFTWYIKKGDPE